jgi:hypothetical protein
MPINADVILGASKGLTMLVSRIHVLKGLEHQTDLL